MLADRICLLTEALHISISDIAKAGGCSSSNLSRLKSGTRTPLPSSPTISYLVKGVLELCRERGLRDRLSDITGISAACSAPQAEAEMIRWFYGGGDAPEINHMTALSSASRALFFGSRLDQLMNLTSVSNGTLSRRSGITPSYISRLRRGERIPKYSSEYLDEICKVLLSDIEENGRTEEFTELTGIKADLPFDERISALHAWMFDYEIAVSHAAVNNLLSTILAVGSGGYKAGDSLSGEMLRISNDYAPDIKDIYTGSEGIRTAATRFLNEAVRGDSGTILLYSDRDMEWMGGSFRPLLSSLMLQCIKKGTRINIIHNVDRSMPELVEAIRWWLPLYMTGYVTSYYSKLSAGNRFSHTLFINPGKSAVSSFHYKGDDESALFRYYTDPESISSAERIFNSLLKHSAPLVDITPGMKPERSDITGDGLRLKMTGTNVTIKRTNDPLLSFHINHPLICRAFRSCLGID